jgi:peptidoglycan/LPS O-acetylase OafA/YrhL
MNVQAARPKSRIEILDSLRAIAALSVCAFHFVCTTTGFIKSEKLKEVFSAGQYGVQLFFVISGFVIPFAMHQAGYQFRDFFKFFLKRLFRLEPPYLFSILLVLVILYAREHFLGRSNDHIDVNPTQVLLHFGYLIPFFEGYQWLNQVYWTLAIEFQYYLLIALLFIPLVRAVLWQRIFFYACVLGVSFFNDGRFLPAWLPLFTLGILMFLFKTGYIDAAEYGIVTTVIVITGFFIYPVFAVVYSIIPVLAVLIFPSRRLPVFHGIGKFSYSIYLVHPVLGAALINILSHHVESPMLKFLLIVAGFAITLVSAYVVYLFVERPSSRLSAAVNYKESVNINRYIFAIKEAYGLSRGKKP